MRAKARAAGMKRFESREFTIGEELAEACPSLVVIKGAEHFPQDDAGHELAQVVLDFIRANKP